MTRTLAPGKPGYTVIPPAFDHLAIRPNVGREIRITKHSGTGDALLAQWNGETLTSPWLEHQRLLSGGELRVSAEQ